MHNLSQLFETNPSLKHFHKNTRIQLHIVKHFKSFFGKLANELTVLFVKDKTLYLEAYNPMWMTEINFFEKEILKKINKDLKKREHVKKIKLSLGKLKDKKNPSKSKPETVSMTFEEKIKVENEIRIKNGESLCNRCNDVYTDSDICIFCRSQESFYK